MTSLGDNIVLAYALLAKHAELRPQAVRRLDIQGLAIYDDRARMLRYILEQLAERAPIAPEVTATSLARRINNMQTMFDGDNLSRGFVSQWSPHRYRRGSALTHYRAWKSDR